MAVPRGPVDQIGQRDREIVAPEQGGRRSSVSKRTRSAASATRMVTKASAPRVRSSDWPCARRTSWTG
jgi:hypothetical protein